MTWNLTQIDKRCHADVLEREANFRRAHHARARRRRGGDDDDARTRLSGPRCCCHCRRLDDDDDDVDAYDDNDDDDKKMKKKHEAGGYKSHKLRKEDAKEELEDNVKHRKRSMTTEGRETLDERDLMYLSRRMAALERKMRSVDGEMQERVRVQYYEAGLCLFVGVLLSGWL